MTFEQQLAEHLTLNNSDYTRLILDTLPGETHKEKFDYLVKLMHDRDTYKSEIEAAEGIARRVIEEIKDLEKRLSDSVEHSMKVMHERGVKLFEYQDMVRVLEAKLAGQE